MENNRNFFITIALSVLILTLWQVFYMNPRIEAQREAARIEAERAEAEKKATTPAAPGEGAALPGAATTPGNVPGTSVPGTDGALALDRQSAITATPRVKIETPSLSGSINLKGARIDDVRLKDYRLTVEKDSPIIELLNPSALPNGQYAEIGFVGNAASGAVPGPDTVWTVEGNQTLTPSTPVTLVFTNDKGLTFKRTIVVDDNYMFTVTDTVSNAGTVPVTLSNYGRVTRFDKPTHASIYVLHEGLIGVTGEEGLRGDKLFDHRGRQADQARQVEGWLVGHHRQILGGRSGAFNASRNSSQAIPISRTFARATSQTSLADPIAIAPGQSSIVETQVFAGAKEVAKIQAYETDRKIRQFDLLIDWGWFYFITKPMFWLIDTLYRFLGNFGLAILATTVIVKGVFFPLANKSYKSMANMKMVQPAMLEIREKYADDKMKQQQAMMELYKKEKINPLAGCWPILIQIPVFFALYKVLYVTIEMRHAPFFGWIQDLAAPDPTSIFNLFGLLPFAVPAFLPHLGVWAVVMGITMFLQMRMNPTPPDPTQAMIFNWMPLVFTVMMGSFPAGLVIYWAWNNSLSILQQGIIMKRQGAKIELWDNLIGLFKKKPSPAE